jgi:predicted RNase H-like nuclease (RuvC/YqgF family)
MEKYQAPHEKLSEEEIKKEIDFLLNSILMFKKKWTNFDWQIDEFIEKQEESIFKLRRHFSPEKTTIMKLSVKELSELTKDEIWEK